MPLCNSFLDHFFSCVISGVQSNRMESWCIGICWKIHKCHSSVVLGSWASFQKFALLVTPPSWYVPGSPVSWVKVQVIGKYYAYGKTTEFITCFGSSLRHRQRPGPAAQHLACRVPQRPGLLVKQWWRPFQRLGKNKNIPTGKKIMGQGHSFYL